MLCGSGGAHARGGRSNGKVVRERIRGAAVWGHRSGRLEPGDRAQRGRTERGWLREVGDGRARSPGLQCALNSKSVYCAWLQVNRAFSA